MTIHVPTPEELEELPVLVDRSGPEGVVSMMAWAGNSAVTIVWDDNRDSVFLKWTEANDFGVDVRLTADRSEVSRITVEEIGPNRAEIRILWGPPGAQRQVVARVMDPIEVTDTPVEA